MTARSQEVQSHTCKELWVTHKTSQPDLCRAAFFNGHQSLYQLNSITVLASFNSAQQPCTHDKTSQEDRPEHLNSHPFFKERKREESQVLISARDIGSRRVELRSLILNSSSLVSNSASWVQLPLRYSDRILLWFW